GLVLHENSDESTGKTLNVANTSFAGTLATYIEETSLGTKVNATGATFGGLTASSLTLAQAYAVEDKILDIIDVPGYGFVRLQNGEVFVSQLSETTTAGAISRGVGAADPADAVDVQTGTFHDDVTVNKAGLHLFGAGPGLTTVSGPIGGTGPTPGSTIGVSANNVEIA